jgi:hypothetical protein
LRALAALKLSGRGSHVPSSFDLAPCSGRGRTWEHDWSKQIALALVRAARAFDAFLLWARLRHGGYAFVFPLEADPFRSIPDVIWLILSDLSADQRPLANAAEPY